ncbi:hypothetical protein [Aestuariispira ectoiniformans]|uniref:hypothetical protein n=1 Tax=Aestuariispira ectoiniformans TaxID=2775080 RepID=UPI00223BB6D2|nr:hypothetical protein [Aestuariispira ectoiniformans]
MSRPNRFQVENTIGKTYDVDPKDVLRTKTALHNLNHYDMPDWGLSDTPDQAMVDGIKAFQKKHDLTSDGIMQPGGPTEQKINEELDRVKDRPVQVAAAGFVPATLPPPPGVPNLNKEATEKAGEVLAREVRGLPDAIEEGRVETADQLLQLFPLLGDISGKSVIQLDDGQKIVVDDLKETEPGSSLFSAKFKDGAEMLLVPRSINGGPTFWSKANNTPDWKPSTRTQIADPAEPSPGLIPPKPPQGRREEFPSDPSEGPSTTEFPANDHEDSIYLPLPIDDPLKGLIFHESRGNKETQAKTNKSIEMAMDALTKALTKELKNLGIEVEHIHGGHTPEKYLKDGEISYKKERLWKLNKAIRAMRADLEVRLKKDGETIGLFAGNTVDTRKDGITLTDREADAEDRFHKHQKLSGELVEFINLPKLPGMDLDEWAEKMKPAVDKQVDALVKKIMAQILK